MLKTEPSVYPRNSGWASQIKFWLLLGSPPKETNTKTKTEPEVVVHTCNPSTKEAEAGGSGIPGQPRTHIVKPFLKKEK
jgi:hypothetical protein